MKKSITKLSLRKNAISKLDNLKGGSVANPVAAGTNAFSGCHICNTVRKTQCKGDECPKFSHSCPDKPSPVGI